MSRRVCSLVAFAAVALAFVADPAVAQTTTTRSEGFVRRKVAS